MTDPAEPSTPATPHPGAAEQLDVGALGEWDHHRELLGLLLAVGAIGLEQSEQIGRAHV